MRKLLLALTIAVGLSVPSNAAVSVVQAISAFGSPLHVTLTATTGNLLFLVAGFDGNGGGCGTIAVSDTVNTYTPISNYVSRVSNCSRDYYAQNITGGSLTVSVTAAHVGVMVVYEIAGASTSSPLDSSVTTSGTCDASPCTSSSFSTTGTDEIVFMGVTNYYSGGTWTAGNIAGGAGTINASGKNAGSGDQVSAGAAEYRIFTSTQSSVTAAITLSGSVYMDYFTAGFVGGGGGGGAKVKHRVIGF